MIDFETLTLKASPNQYLIAPDGLCQNATPHAQAPVFSVPVSALQEAWRQMLSEQPRIEPVEADETLQQYEVIQRSLIFRFPDRVTVRFIPVADGSGTTVAVYSRSEVGYSDLGVNKKRVAAWLAALERLLAGSAGA